MRERWDSKLIFIMAAVGSAVGLGNIWRFPYLVGKYGGGSFLIPYLIMLIIIGIPVMILEFGIGQKMQKGSVKSLAKINKNLSSVGYAAILIDFFLVMYYAVIIAWSLIYFIGSFRLAFKENTQAYFNNVLQLSPSINQIGNISIPILIALAAVWVIIFLSVHKGISSISKAVKVMLPIPFILIIALVVRSLMLPGAIHGILFYLKPDFASLLDIEVWSAAIAQAFFSLSICYGIMIAYSSYESKNADITKNAFIISFLDFFIALISGFAVFGTLGFMATQQSVSVASLATQGPGLAFIVFPQALLMIPGSAIFSVIFFLILLLLGLTSAISMVEAVATPITDVVGQKHETKVAAIICILAGLLGIIYTTGAGMYFLDIVDHFITLYPLLLIGLLECIAVGWIYGSEKMRKYVNSVSDWKLGRWWNISIKYITPILLSFLLVFLLIKELTTPYGNYPSWALSIGWIIVTFIIVSSIILHHIPKMIKRKIHYPKKT